MLVVYRIGWIVGLIALIAEMVILANPRQAAPQKVSDWQVVQQGRFRLRAPKQFQVERDSWLLTLRLRENQEVKLADHLLVGRGERTGVVLAIATPAGRMHNPPLPGASSPPSGMDMRQFLRRAHDLMLASLREDVSRANFQEKQRRMVRLRGVQGLRSDYEFVLTHPIPFLSMPVRGYLITVPISSNEALHINAYCPPNSFGDYQKVFDQMIATLEVQQGSGMPGGWM